MTMATLTAVMNTKSLGAVAGMAVAAVMVAVAAATTAAAVGTA